MKLIVGLGNPGLIYAGSRHNIGFEIVKYLAKASKVALKKEKGIRALSGKLRIGPCDILLALPLTFMNLSGEAVASLIKKYKVSISDLLIVCDDLDLDFGRIRVRTCGSSAGHRGVESVINSLKSDKFNRLRIGIGRPGEKKDTKDFVLSRFNRREKINIPKIIDKAKNCCMEWVEGGAVCAMNSFNRKDA